MTAQHYRSRYGRDLLNMTERDRCLGCNGSRVYCDGRLHVYGERCCGWCDHVEHGNVDDSYGG